MSGLADFLRARIAEDETRARILRESRANAWSQNLWDGTVVPYADSPERIGAECEAKRRIVDWHVLVSGADVDGEPVIGCATCIGTDSGVTFTVAGPCLTLRLLALPYADHADYDEGWRL